MQFDVLRAACKAVLEHPLGFDWTVQGFGFIRTYFGDKRVRLNVWDPALTFNSVSTIHDHPWAFQSWVISGQFFNQRYVEELGSIASFLAPTHNFGVLHTGVDGGMTAERGTARLIACRREAYLVGDTYRQAADEIHRSEFSPGAVTINERLGDTERARVFWPIDEEWKDAMPRYATEKEVARTTALALMKWEG